MAFLSPRERAFVAAISQLAYANPFLPERIDCEGAALGPEFVQGGAVWSLPVDEPEQVRVNIELIGKRLEPLAEQLRSRLTAGIAATDQDLTLYEDAAIHVLYLRYQAAIFEADF